MLIEPWVNARCLVGIINPADKVSDVWLIKSEYQVRVKVSGKKKRIFSLTLLSCTLLIQIFFPRLFSIHISLVRNFV